MIDGEMRRGEALGDIVVPDGRESSLFDICSTFSTGAHF